MSASAWRIVFGVVCAVAVPAVALHALAGAERRTMELTAAPFAWRPLLVAHLAAAVPLAFVVGTWFSSSVEERLRASRDWAWSAVGVAFIAIVVVVGPGLTRSLESSQAGFVVRAGARTAVALVLVLPWVVLVMRRSGYMARGRYARSLLAAGIVFALVPPAAYAHRVVEVRSDELDSVLETGRLAKAGRILQGLCEIGSSRLVASMAPTRARLATAAAVERLGRAVDRDLSPGASAAIRRNQAFTLVQLDRLGEAESILRPLTALDPDAALLLGAVYRDQERWAESEATFRGALFTTLSKAPRVAGVTRERCVTAYDGLAETARAGGRPGDAERAYLEAARRLPSRAAYFALQLGRHYMTVGRPAAALGSFREAVRLDSKLEAQVRPLMHQMRVRTPACLLTD